jgi:hypothetical protein
MQKCGNCNILEKYPGMYYACRGCIAEKVQVAKVYCGEYCMGKYESDSWALTVVLTIHFL